MESTEVSVENGVDGDDGDENRVDVGADDHGGDGGGGRDDDGDDDVESKAKEERGSDDVLSRNNVDAVDGRFDHTSRKVVVHNVLKYIRHKELQKMVSSWLAGHEDKNIVIVGTKKPPRDNWVKLTFEHENMVNPFIDIINTGGENGAALSNGRGRSLFAKRADEMHRDDGGRGDDCNDRGRKRGGGDIGDDDDANDNDDVDDNARGDDAIHNHKRNKTSSSYTSASSSAGGGTPLRVLSSDGVRDAITPLWRMTYEEQLDAKMREMVNKCAKVIIKEIRYKFK